MMASHEFLEILEGKPKQPDLIIEQKKGKWVAYFRRSTHRIGIGNTEKEALENLSKLIK